MSVIDALLRGIKPVRFVSGLAAFVSSVAIGCAALTAQAAEIDPTFAAGHGYVPIAATETESDLVVAVVREANNRVVVLGRRIVAGRGVLLLQRYAPDGTLDETFGDKGLLTVDVPGISLTPRELFLQPSGRLIVVAESPGTVRMLAFDSSGQPDTTYGIAGEQQVPLNAGIPAASASFQLVTTPLRRDGQIVIMPNAQGASGSNLGVTLYRYTIDGKVDVDFGTNGKLVLNNVAPGLAFTGVSAQLLDGRYVLAAASTTPGNPTRTLIVLAKDGTPDTIGFGPNGMITPAELQGKDIRAIAPLANNFFLVAANTSSLATLNRFDPVGRIDMQFGSAGTVRVEPAGGGLVLIDDVFEQVDNNVIVTGTANNRLFVARYLTRGVIDPNYNAGKGPQVVAEPSANLTRGVVSVNFDGSQTLSFGNAVAFGANPGSPTAPSRAFFLSTTDGVLDAGYAGKGIIPLFGRKAPFGEFVQQILPLPDGRVAVLSASGIEGGLIVALSRFLPDGSIDTTFGTGGRTTFKQNGQCEWPLSMALQPDGKIVVLGTSFDNFDCVSGAMFGKRFDTNGTVESYVLVYAGTAQRARSAGVGAQSDNRVVVTGQDDRSLVIARFATTGASDPSFGNNGRLLWLRGPNDLAKGGALVVQSDQKIVAAGSMNGTHLVLLRSTAGGQLDPSFGSGGVSLVEVTSSGFLDVQGLKQTPSGRFVMLARLGQRPLLAQFTANGALDTSFGTNGLVTLPMFVGGSQYSRFGLAVQNDGGIVVSGQTTDTPASAIALTRLSPNGQPDPQFGPGGVLTYRPSVYFAAGANAIAASDNGSLFVGAYGAPGSLLLKVRNPIVSGTVVEFYNTILDHYFITADPAEVAAIDAGAAGPGWSKTNLGFRVYTNAFGVPTTAIPVCRFYGSTSINPATGQRRGPNSHFYTAVAPECAAVKTDPGWTYESIAFFTIAPDANGGCASGLVAVYRVYNNRFAQNDSNHRYTTDLSVYQQMQSKGWKPEGIAFCTPAG